MTTKNKIKLLISSLLVLLPCLFGLLVWDHLPEAVVGHWGMDGKADGMISPLGLVVVLPLILLVLHWVCIAVTLWDNKRKGQSEKVMNLVFWIIPVTSLVVSVILYSSAFDDQWDVLIPVCFLLGILFLVIGNYLPKCKPNLTVGIKLRWTLANEENWYRTHRLGGKLSVVAGLLCFPLAFLPVEAFPFVMIALIALVTGVPTVYSYCFYKKQLREGTATKEDYRSKDTKKQKLYTVITVILAAVILVGCGILMFTGNIEVQYNEASFTLSATYWEDLTVEYAAIESVEYREEGSEGSRIGGFGSPRLSLGLFRNEEFGNHTRYTYTQCTPCIVLKTDGKVAIISLEDEAQTKALYIELLFRTKTQ